MALSSDQARAIDACFTEEKVLRGASFETVRTHVVPENLRKLLTQLMEEQNRLQARISTLEMYSRRY